MYLVSQLTIGWAILENNVLQRQVRFLIDRFTQNLSLEFDAEMSHIWRRLTASSLLFLPVP